MADVKLDYSNIGSIAVPSVGNLISSLNKVINFLEQNNPPSGFSKKTVFYNVISDLKRQRNTLSSVKDWIVNSNKNYDSLIDKLDQQASKLPSYEFKKRDKVL